MLIIKHWTTVMYMALSLKTISCWSFQINKHFCDVLSEHFSVWWMIYVIFRLLYYNIEFIKTLCFGKLMFEPFETAVYEFFRCCFFFMINSRTFSTLSFTGIKVYSALYERTRRKRQLKSIEKASGMIHVTIVSKFK